MLSSRGFCGRHPCCATGDRATFKSARPAFIPNYVSRTVGVLGGGATGPSVIFSSGGFVDVTTLSNPDTKADHHAALGYVLQLAHGP